MILETLHELCETLSHELEDVNEKIRSGGGGMSAGDLELVDKLTHALKSVKTSIAMIESEDGYSSRRYDYSRKRDRMGRYSRTDGMDSLLDEMRGMMSGLPEEKRREVQRFLDRMG